MSESISPEKYWEAKSWFQEAIICRDRSFLIYAYTCFVKQNDFHGAIEALQHANELSLKSLYLLLGEDWKWGHNPAKDIDDVFEIYFKIFPSLKTNDMMLRYIKWIKKHGQEMYHLHSQTIYGKNMDDKLILPSKAFNNKDYGRWIHRTNNLITVLEGFFLNIGKLLNILDENEEKSIKSLAERSHKIRTDDRYRHNIEKFVKNGLNV